MTDFGRDVDAFHGIAQNTSTSAVGFEGYLAWAAAAAIVAPTTLYAVFSIKPPNLSVYRGGALKCLTLIAFWSLAAAGLRVVDYVIALSLDLPRAVYDSLMMAAFNLATGLVALWLRRNLAKGGLSSAVIAAFSGVLTVLTVTQLVVSVSLAPRYGESPPLSPDAIYGNDLAQQITSTFDVAVCGLSLAILAAVLVIGPLAGWVLRRRGTASGATASETGTVPAAAATTTAIPRPQPTVMPKIARRNEAAAKHVANPAAATMASSTATTSLQIQRRSEPTPEQPAADAAEHDATAEPLSPKARAEKLLEESSRRFAAGTTYGDATSRIPDPDPDTRRG